MSAFSVAADLLDPQPVEMTHEAWCKGNLPHIFPLAFGPHHHWLFSRVGDRPAGVRAFGAAPRGSGKTTAMIFGVPLAAIALGTHHFIVIVRATDTEAWAALELIQDELERNQELVERWPALRVAKRINTNRDRKNKQGELALRGGRIVAIGAGSKLRGLLRKDEYGKLIRPDLFLFDDLEDAEQARSKIRTNRLEEWVFADVANLGGPVGGGRSEPAQLDIVGIGTTLDTDALAVRAIKHKGRFRTWDTKAFPAEFVDEQGGRKANWPQGQPLAFLKTLLDADSQQFIGSYTYAKEYLLDPRQRTDTLVKAEWLRWGKAPAALAYPSLGIDPAATEDALADADYSALVAGGLEPGAKPKVWVTAVWRDWVTMHKLFDQAERMARDPRTNIQHTTIAFEAVAGFRWGIQEMRRRVLAGRGVAPQVDKVSRFAVVAMAYEAGWVWHDDALKDTDFEEEILNFPGGDHDDFVDALYHMVMLATNAGKRFPKNVPSENGNGRVYA